MGKHKITKHKMALAKTKKNV